MFLFFLMSAFVRVTNIDNVPQTIQFNKQKYYVDYNLLNKKVLSYFVLVN